MLTKFIFPIFTFLCTIIFDIKNYLLTLTQKYVCSILKKNVRREPVLNNSVLMKIQSDDYNNELPAIEYELILPSNTSEINTQKAYIYRKIETIDENLNLINHQVEELNSKIDNLTNHADGIDYAIAVTCGIVTEIIDSFFVGEWDFKNAKAISNKQINDKVMDFAKKDPEYMDFVNNKQKNNDPNRLDNAIEFLEKKYKLPGDGEYKDYKSFGVNDSTHHLDDFCHHPTLIGLICCILVQFSKNPTATYRTSTGAIIKLPIEVNQYGEFVSENKWGKIFAGVINWFFNIAQTVTNRKGHLLSDMAGSSTSAGKGNEGAGIPGSFLSLAKELSTLPCFKDTNFAENLRKAYQNGIGSGNKQLDLGIFNSLFEGASSKVDMRTEMAVSHELKRQSLPVIINEILVRSIYFIRRFILQMKEKHSLREIDWKTTLPLKNRTIVRMMTIATGTFTAVDLADAGIRAVIKSGGINPATLKNFILRVNFVGVGRFAIAVASDISMEAKKNAAENKKLLLQSKELQYLNAKIYYKDGLTWIAAQEAGKEIDEAYSKMEETAKDFFENYCEISENIQSITSEVVTGINKYNEDIIANALDILEF